MLKLDASAVPIATWKAIEPSSIRIPEGPSAHATNGIPLSANTLAAPPNAPATPAVTPAGDIPIPLESLIKSSVGN